MKATAVTSSRNKSAVLSEQELAEVYV